MPVSHPTRDRQQRRTATTPTRCSWRCPTTGPSHRATSGYAGTASDGLSQLDADHRLTADPLGRQAGNVVQTAPVNPSSDRHDHARARLRPTPAASRHRVAGARARTLRRTSRAYRAELGRPRRGAGRAAPLAAVPDPGALERGRCYLSANVLKASEDKTFPGAVVASLAPPVGAGGGGKGRPAPSYSGSYREIFARDLYEAFTGLLAAGDLSNGAGPSCSSSCASNARRLDAAQLACSTASLAPDSFGDQLDEVSYPILMARQSGLDHDRALTSTTSRRPPTSSSPRPELRLERWEEQGGYSPSTIAAEIAGLPAAAHRRTNGTSPCARLPCDRRPVPAQHQGLDGDDERALLSSAATSSGSPRTATPTPR